MSWVDYLILRKDEKIVDSWQGMREIIGEPVEVAMEEKQQKRKKNNSIR